MESGSEIPGELHWEVSHFGNPQFCSVLRTYEKDANLPVQLKGERELQDDKGQLDNVIEDAAVRTRPDPSWPSGICSVIIDHVVNLKHRNLKGSDGNRKGREFEPLRKVEKTKRRKIRSLL